MCILSYWFVILCIYTLLGIWFLHEVNSKGCSKELPASCWRSLCHKKVFRELLRWSGTWISSLFSCWFLVISFKNYIILEGLPTITFLSRKCISLSVAEFLKLHLYNVCLIFLLHVFIRCGSWHGLLQYLGIILGSKVMATAGLMVL